MSLTGKGTVFGVDGAVAYSGPAVGYGQAISSLSMTDEAKVEEFVGGDAEVLGFSVRDKRRRVTIDLFPKATTADLAKSSLVLPAIPSKVTLSSFMDTSSPSLGINGDWVYIGGGTLALSEGQARMTLPLVQYTTSSLTATQLTTAVA